MTSTRPVLRVGLTGGIASGKTTVALYMADLGAFVQDADRIAHEVMGAGGAAYDGVVECFGRSVLDTEGEIDREKLGRLVFEDSEARRSLDAIVHPRVREEAELRLQRYLEQGTAKVAVFDAALLFETGSYKSFDRLVVVKCSRDAQLRRLLARGRISRREAVSRVDVQAPLQDKLAVADYVIETEWTLKRTELQTRQVYRSLLEDFEKISGADPV